MIATIVMIILIILFVLLIGTWLAFRKKPVCPACGDHSGEFIGMNFLRGTHYGCLHCQHEWHAGEEQSA